MNSNDFVVAIERYVGDTTIENTMSNLASPPGKLPGPSGIARAHWYNGLSAEDKAHLSSAVAEAVRTTIFGMLAVLDGARIIDDGNGVFELTYVTEDMRTRLNPPDTDLPTCTTCYILIGMALSPEWLSDVWLECPNCNRSRGAR